MQPASESNVKMKFDSPTTRKLFFESLTHLELKKQKPFSKAVSDCYWAKINSDVDLDSYTVTSEDVKRILQSFIY